MMIDKNQVQQYRAQIQCAINRIDDDLRRIAQQSDLDSTTDDGLVKWAALINEYYLLEDIDQ